MPYADVPGAQLYYTDTGGEGVPIVLMHAASGNAGCWVQQVPAFTAAGYRCIAYDRRGWGRSKATLPEALEGNVATAASDDLQALAGHLKLDRFHLAGTAAGAGPSLDYALTYPERVRSLVLADCGAGASAEPAYEAMRKNYRPPEIEHLPVQLRELSAGYRATNPDGVRQWLEIEHNSRHGERGGPAQRAHHEVTFAVLRGLKTPVLMICGSADITTPPALMRLSAEHIPGCRFETISEAGHASFWEQPEIWSRLVLDFTGQH